MNDTLEIRNYRHTYYRNGVGGQGHWLSTFEWKDKDDTKNRWIACVATMWNSPSSNSWKEGSDNEIPNECSLMVINDLVKMNKGKYDYEDMPQIGSSPPVWRATDYFLPAILPYFEAYQEYKKVMRGY